MVVTGRLTDHATSSLANATMQPNSGMNSTILNNIAACVLAACSCQGVLKYQKNIIGLYSAQKVNVFQS